MGAGKTCRLGKRNSKIAESFRPGRKDAPTLVKNGEEKGAF